QMIAGSKPPVSHLHIPAHRRRTRVITRDHAPEGEALRSSATRAAPSRSPARSRSPADIFARRASMSAIDLREGDILEALGDLEGPVDFVLLDIWTPLARPVLELVATHLRTGAIVATDNTAKRRHEYGALLAYLGNPANGFITQTLPFDGGFEISVKVTGT